MVPLPPPNRPNYGKAKADQQSPPAATPPSSKRFRDPTAGSPNAPSQPQFPELSLDSDIISPQPSDRRRFKNHRPIIVASTAVLGIVILVAGSILLVNSTSRVKPLDGTEIYNRLLNSTVFIVKVDENVFGAPPVGLGSGVLIHIPRKLVLTNFHVVGDRGKARIFFPKRNDKNGDVLTDPRDYMDNKDTWGITGRVVQASREKDLALIELDQLPKNARAIPFSPEPAAVGSKLYSIGASGIEPDFSGTLWRLSTGEVRARSKRVVHFPDRIVDAWVLESQKPTNYGDSGGPSVNEYGELVGIVSMTDLKRDAVKFDIDIVEVRDFVAKFARDNNWTWEEPPPRRRGSSSRFDSPNDSASPTSSQEPVNEPSLAEKLQSQDPNQRLQAARATAQLQRSEIQPHLPLLIRLLEDENQQIQAAAAEAIEKSWPPQKSDLPLYESALQSKNAVARRLALRLYANHDDLQLPTALLTIVANELATTEPDVQLDALQVLSRRGGISKEIALQQLLKVAGANSSEVSQRALEIIQTFAPFVTADIPALTEALQSPSAKVRAFVISQLSGLAPNFATAREWFEPRLNDNDPRVVQAALAGLARWKMEAQPLLGKILPHADSDNIELAQTALAAINIIGKPNDLISVYANIAADANRADPIRSFALDLLSKAIAHPKVEISVVTMLLSSPDPKIRTAVLERLADEGPMAKSALRQVMEQLSAKEQAVQLAALTAISKIGEANEVIAVYANIAADANRADPIRSFAQDLLSKAIAHPKVEISVVTMLLSSPDPKIRTAVLERLADEGPMARSAIRAVVDRLSDTEEAVKMAALKAIAAIGPKETEVDAIAAIISKDKQLALPAVEILASIGPKAIDPLAKTLNMLMIEQEMAEKVMESLGKFGPNAQAAVPQILAAINQPGHPLSQLRDASLNKLSLTESWQPDPASKALMRIGGDKLATSLFPLLEWEYTTVGGRKVKRAKHAPDLKIQFWAVAVLSAVDPNTLSEEVRKTTEQRLQLLVKYDPDHFIRSVAKTGLLKYEKK
jgi:S1-C subfamily serine protease